MNFLKLPGVNRSRIIGLAIALTCSLALAAAALAGRAADPVTVNVVYAKPASQAAFYVADQKGFFAKYGIKINYIQSTNTAVVLASGGADLALTGATFAYSSAASGHPTPILASVTKYTFGYLMVRKSEDSPSYHKAYPANVKALPKGITIGANSPGSVNALWLNAIMSGAGLAEGSDYHIAYFGSFPAILAALQSRQIGAALLVPPTSSQASIQGIATSVLTNSDPDVPKSARVFTGAVVIGRKGWLDSNQTPARNIVTALTQAMKYMHDPANWPEVTEIVASATGSDVSTIRDSLPDVVGMTSPVVSCTTFGNEMNAYFKVNQLHIRADCGDIAYRSLAPTKDPFTLNATVKAGKGGVSLVLPGPLTTGSYTVAVSDKSKLSGFVLTGPGVKKSTTAPFRGAASWVVPLKAGTYRYGLVGGPMRSFKVSK
jgi:ABC-type nitrate/sulfonate/bicarbonate transport system substrate-binding protein